MFRLLLYFFCFICTGLFAQSKLECVVLKTNKPENKEVSIWYRVPKNYSRTSDTNYRVLIFFGGRNCTGQNEANGSLGFGQWADENDIFIVATGFKNDNYWDPKQWSGDVLFSALNEIRKKYKICTTKLLFYGFSAGGQCSNAFPAFKPENTRAWVSHACGYFHKPIPAMKDMPGLITCGDADRQRFVISRNFIDEYRKLGANILWKSFPNRPHDVPSGSLYLAMAFLEYYHKLYIDDLKSNINTIPSKESKKIIYVGDDQDSVIYPADSPEAKNIYSTKFLFKSNSCIIFNQHA